MQETSTGENETDSSRDILFSFWQDLPIIELISLEKFQSIADHPIRDAMVQVLRRGIVDENRGKRRHAMNLAELLPEIEEFIEESTKQKSNLKRTALYHHRDILLEHGFIQEVATILEGKRYVTYYGRTARAFIGDHDSSGKIKDISEILRLLLQNIQSDFDEHRLEELLSSLEQQAINAHHRALSWIEDHVDLFNELDLDAIEVYRIISPFFIKPTEEWKTVSNLFDSENS